MKPETSSPCPQHVATVPCPHSEESVHILPHFILKAHCNITKLLRPCVLSGLLFGAFQTAFVRNSRLCQAGYRCSHSHDRIIIGEEYKL
jgi:hypothetical protein